MLAPPHGSFLDAVDRLHGAAQWVVERLPFCVMVTDLTGRVIELNAAAREFLSAGRGLRLVKGQLRADCDADQDKLDAAFAAVRPSAGRTAPAPQPVLLTSDGVEAPVALMVNAPAAGACVAGDTAADNGLAIISISDAPRRATADQEAMLRLFGLSPAQARLAGLLVSGCSVKEAARILGIAESSARQCLKIIFCKTGIRRQADLVRVLGNALMLQIRAG